MPKNKKIKKPVKYLAPIFIEVEAKQVFRSPGISSQLPWHPAPGTSCQMHQKISHVQITDENSPEIWEHLDLAIVPPGKLTPDQQTGILVLGSQKIIHTLPLSETNQEWEKISVVIISPTYYEYLAPHLETQKYNQNYGEYYSPDYRMTVTLSSEEILAPPTWIKEE